MEMVTDRPLDFSETELNFGNYQPPRMAVTEAQPASGSKQRTPLPRGRFPF